jgi:hypothetical protein
LICFISFPEAASAVAASEDATGERVVSEIGSLSSAVVCVVVVLSPVLWVAENCFNSSYKDVIIIHLHQKAAQSHLLGN